MLSLLLVQIWRLILVLFLPRLTGHSQTEPVPLHHTSRLDPVLVQDLDPAPRLALGQVQNAPLPPPVHL